ncbi:MAG TPA: UDP-N-acetylmuramate dehydrogenase [Thermoanaerobaculia bacterium]|nr:UDP-N-acetylmuramate dehydrogenase [Thermoanaerobaculia bacterium]
MAAVPTDLVIESDVPLAPFTTLAIGGPARWMTRASSVPELRRALEWADDREAGVLLLGGGSNMLVADAGFPGLVIRIDLRGIEIHPEDGYSRLVAAAGEPWDPLVARIVEQELAGFECLAGIPGLVGATPIQNVGAYDQEVSETIVEVEALDRSDGSLVRISNHDCRFRYRDSRFKSEERDRFIILAVHYRLDPGGAPAVRYPDLARRLEEQRPGTTLASVRDAVLAARRSKGMVIDPADPDSRSAGSFFTNPVVDRSVYEELVEKERSSGRIGADERVPAFEASGDRVKLSAAWLIERSGFQRGMIQGRVGLSSKHTLAIINRGGGTAGEVIHLVGLIRRGVLDRFGILLVPEPNLIGLTLEE